MSKSYVTVAPVAIDSSSESGRRKFDNEGAIMADEAIAEDQTQSNRVAGDQAGWSTTGLRKFPCYNAS
jgi:hypothetical protein